MLLNGTVYPDPTVNVNWTGVRWDGMPDSTVDVKTKKKRKLEANGRVVCSWQAWHLN